jgi:hypothetical protein
LSIHPTYYYARRVQPLYARRSSRSTRVVHSNKHTTAADCSPAMTLSRGKFIANGPRCQVSLHRRQAKFHGSRGRTVPYECQCSARRRSNSAVGKEWPRDYFLLDRRFPHIQHAERPCIKSPRHLNQGTDASTREAFNSTVRSPRHRNRGGSTFRNSAPGGPAK